MARRTAPLLPPTRRLLTELGERLKLARRRRKLTARQVAERAGMSPMTLRSVETGREGVTMGAYLAVMQVLGLEQDLTQLAAVDEVGRQLQDARLLKPTPSAAPRSATAESGRISITRKKGAVERSQVANQGAASPGATTAQELAELLQSPTRKKDKE